MPESASVLAERLVEHGFESVESLQGVLEGFKNDFDDSRLCWVGLSLACRSLPRQQASMFVLAGMKLEMYSLVMEYLSGMRVSKQLNEIKAIAIDTLPILLENHHEIIAGGESKVLDFLLCGMVFAADIASAVADHVRQKRYIRLLSSIHWKIASAVRHDVSVADEPLGSRNQIDSFARENSWVWNPSCHTPGDQPVQGGVANSFFFASPYFAWPEGKWEVEDGIGGSPFFTLKATARGSGVSCFGVMVDKDQSAWTVHGKFVHMLATANRPVCGYFCGSLVSSNGVEYTMQLEIVGDSLVGSMKFGNERKSIVAVPRRTHVPASLFESKASFTEFRSQFLAVQPKHRLKIPGSILNFSSGWTVEIWVQNGDNDLSLFSFYDCEIRIHIADGAMQVAIWDCIEDKVEKTVLVEGFNSRNLWLQVHCFGDIDTGLSVHVDGTCVIENHFGRAQLNETISSQHGLALGPPRIQEMVVRNLTVWSQSRSSHLTESGDAVSVYPLHGPSIMALIDVSNREAHLNVEPGSVVFRGFSVTNEIDSTFPVTYAEDDDVVTLGHCTYTPQHVTLMNGSSLWTKQRFGFNGSLHAVYKLSVKPGSDVILALHSGSFCDMIRLGHNPYGPFQSQLRVKVHTFSMQDTQTLSFDVAVTVTAPTLRTLVFVPSTGCTRLSAEEALVLELEYVHDQKELKITAMGKLLLQVNFDIARTLGIVPSDGICVGVLSHDAPIEVRGLHVESTAGELEESKLDGLDLFSSVDLLTSAFPGLQQAGSQWTCTYCTCLNEPEFSLCQTCGIDNKDGGKSEYWKCPKCTLENSSKAPACDACQEPNTSYGSSDMVIIPSEVESSTWTCSSCTLANSSSYSNCTLCNEPRIIDLTIPTVEPVPVVDIGYDSTVSGRGDALGGVLSRFKLPSISDVAHTSEWDTNLGYLSLNISEEGQAHFVTEVQGPFNDAGELRMIAFLENNNIWTMEGCLDLQAGQGIHRTGATRIHMAVNQAGGRITAKFDKDKSWEAKLKPWCNELRGLAYSMKAPVPAGTIEEVVKRDAAMKIAERSRYDPLKSFQPFYGGLGNMEKNLTNVCYQNSLLQCLFMTSALRYVMMFPPPVTKTKDPIFIEMQKLFASLLLSPDTVLYTNDLQAVLGSEWTTGQQMDVSDFLNHVLNQLSMVFPAGTVDKVFGCNTTHQLRCTSCNQHKVMKETSLGLAVTLPTQFLPITNIKAVSCESISTLIDMKVPAGYERIRMNLNKDKIDAPLVFLCLERRADDVPVTELVVRVCPGNEPPPVAPAGYTRVEQNLNIGAVGSTPDQVWLFFKQDAKGSPITNISFLVGEEEISKSNAGWRVITNNVNPSWSQEVSSSRTRSGDSSPKISQGPSSTPIRLTYRRGMTITDVVLSSGPPDKGSAEYQVIDIPLNSSLMNSPPQDVFLWFSDSNVFDSPITDVLLVHKDKADLSLYETCGPFVFMGDKLLLKRRGQGCPMTELSVYRSPNVAPPFQSHAVSTINNTDHTCNPGDGMWLPRMGNSSTTYPEMLQTCKGKSLRFENKGECRGNFFHGLVKGQGKLFGVLLKKSANLWQFRGVFSPTILPKLAPIEFEVTQEIGKTSISKCDFLGSSTSLVRVSAIAVPDDPIVEIQAFREDDMLPSEYEKVTSTVNNRTNIRFGTRSKSSMYIAYRRGNSEDPIVSVKILSEAEILPDGYEARLTTPSGKNGALNYGAEAHQLFLCFKKQRDAPCLFDMLLQWQDLSPAPPATFTPIKWSVNSTVQADICSPGTVSLYLCTLVRAPHLPTHPNPLNGVYSSGNFAIALRSVSSERLGMRVDGRIRSSSGLMEIHHSDISNCGGLQMQPEDDVSGLFPGLPSTKNVVGNWLLLGDWFEPHKPKCSSIWHFGNDPSCFTTSVTCIEGMEKLTFVKDSYIQLTVSTDFTEQWSDHQMKFSARCSNNSVQSCVNQYFNSAVLDGTNMPLCDEENVKQTHHQTNFMSGPPEHLILTIKTMGYDHTTHRAIKHLESTSFEPVLNLPDDMKSIVYGLYGIVVHTGANANSGHYFAYGRESCDSELHLEDSPTSPWMLFNDSRVQSVSWMEMIRSIENSESNSVYLMFYKRIHQVHNIRGRPGDEGFPVKKARIDIDESDEVAIMARAIELSNAVDVDDVEMEETESLDKEKSVLHRLKNIEKSMPARVQEIYAASHAIYEIESYSLLRQALLEYACMKSE